MRSLKSMIVNLLIIRSVPGGTQEQSCVFTAPLHEGRALNTLIINLHTVDHTLFCLISVSFVLGERAFLTISAKETCESIFFSSL